MVGHSSRGKCVAYQWLVHRFGIAQAMQSPEARFCLERAWAIATGMGAFVGFLLGHDPPPCPLFDTTAASRRQSSRIIECEIAHSATF